MIPCPTGMPWRQARRPLGDGAGLDASPRARLGIDDGIAQLRGLHVALASAGALFLPWFCGGSAKQPWSFRTLPGSWRPAVWLTYLSLLFADFDDVVVLRKCFFTAGPLTSVPLVLPRSREGIV